MLSDSSLRTRVVYDIAVRYMTPLWRIGAAFRGACAVGLWLLLPWFPATALPRAAEAGRAPARRAQQGDCRPVRAPRGHRDDRGPAALRRSGAGAAAADARLRDRPGPDHRAHVERPGPGDDGRELVQPGCAAGPRPDQVPAVDPGQRRRH